MKSEQLIAENNRKRALLSVENEKYYEDLMVYIRTDFLISEEKTEEVLMEMLDHLIEGQEAGKTAAEIFGSDPQAFADEIIEQIPPEDKNSLLIFLTTLGFSLLGWFLLIRGILTLVFSQFKEVDTTVYLVEALVLILVLAGIIITGVAFIFKLIRDSLFKATKSRSFVKESIKAGLFGGLSFILLLLATRFTPKFGYSFNLTWLNSVIIGLLLLVSNLFIKKLRK